MEEIKSGIWTVYVHINKINGKIYVGITSQDVNRRWRKGFGYKLIDKSYFWNAIQKYGWENFEHEIIASHLTEEEAKNFEKLLIVKLETKNPNKGYNNTEGGDGMCGYKHTEDSKQKIAIAQIGSKNHMYGKHLSLEQKQKISHALKGENNPFYGKHHTEEIKKQLSDSQKGINSANYGKCLSEDTKSKISQSRLGKRHTKESINKMSESHKGLLMGTKNPRSKLTEEDVIAIKKMISNGDTHIKIALIFGVSKNLISKIKCGKIWNHINI